ncbi:MAG TPA: hypothetical protein VJ842_16120 [Pyrinomonadaceae bacterium]|nr:hypothetical protein [Pyrinomonadaceae bacterium]
MENNTNPSPAENEEAQNRNLISERQINVMDINLKTIEIRLNGIKDSTHRSRFIFIIMTIVASAILITLWNSTLSWDSGLASLPKIASDEGLQQRISSNRDLVIGEWMKNLVISVGLLGIRVSGTDLAVIGSASLIVIMTWYFYSQRRENRAIVTLLRDCANGYVVQPLGKNICYMVLQGIVQSIVFIDLGKGDAPLSGLGCKEDEEKSTFLIRRVVQALVYLPPITIILIVASDIWSLCMPSPIRPNADALWFSLSNTERVTAVIFELIGILSAIYTGYLCYLSTRFSRATARTLKEYEIFLSKPENFSGGQTNK